MSNPAEGIRRARAEDEALLRGIAEAAYAPYVERMGRRPAPMDDDHAARIAQGQAWLLGDDAFCVLEEKPDAAWLDNVAVRPAAQGRGLGKQLIAFAEKEARSRGHGILRLYTHEKMTENRAMYAALGFRETHRAEQDGFARVFFEKELP